MGLTIDFRGAIAPSLWHMGATPVKEALKKELHTSEYHFKKEKSWKVAGIIIALSLLIFGVFSSWNELKICKLWKYSSLHTSISGAGAFLRAAVPGGLFYPLWKQKILFHHTLGEIALEKTDEKGEWKELSLYAKFLEKKIEQRKDDVELKFQAAFWHAVLHCKDVEGISRVMPDLFCNPLLLSHGKGVLLGSFDKNIPVSNLTTERIKNNSLEELGTTLEPYIK